MSQKEKVLRKSAISILMSNERCIFQLQTCIKFGILGETYVQCVLVYFKKPWFLINCPTENLTSKTYQ